MGFGSVGPPRKSGSTHIVLAVSTPVITPASGDFEAGQIVTMTCATSDATIRYTLDGTNVTGTSPIYTSSFLVSTTTTVKARAFKTGRSDSSLATSVLTITPPSSEFASHTPHRAIPSAVSKSFNGGAHYFVSPSGVNSPSGGTFTNPWQTLSYACSQPVSGTLYLREGIHRWYNAGIASKPDLIIEGYPNELVIIDFGISAFWDTPATAWEPAPIGTGTGYLVNQVGHAQNNTTVTVDTGTGTILPGDTFTVAGSNQVYVVSSFVSNVITYSPGAKAAFPDNAAITVQHAVAGEYVSTATYSSSEVDVTLAGLFGDSWLPLNRYKFVNDLRSANEFFKSGLDGHQSNAEGIYAGPGMWWHSATGLIHIRLAHTNIPWLDNFDYLEVGDNFVTNNYKGEQDPRNLQLVVNRKGEGAKFRLNASGITLRDLVIRGSEENPLQVNAPGCYLDNVWVYQGAQDGFNVSSSGTGFVADWLRLRGNEAPWMARFHGKNRTTKPYLCRINADGPVLNNLEATDCHDTIYFTTAVKSFTLRCPTFDNCCDDVLDVRRQTDGLMLIIRPKFARCGTYISLNTNNPGASPGNDMVIIAPFFDSRRDGYGRPPAATDPNETCENIGRLVGEHGGSSQPPNLYILYPAVTSRKGSITEPGYLADLSRFLGNAPAKRRLLNGIYIQDVGTPSQSVNEAGDMEFGGWVIHTLSGSPGTCSLSGGRTGQVATDLCVNPQVFAHSLDYNIPTDVRLLSGSPAIGAANAPVDAAWVALDPFEPYRTQNESGPVPVALNHLTMDQLFGANAVEV